MPWCFVRGATFFRDATHIFRSPIDCDKKHSQSTLRANLPVPSPRQRATRAQESSRELEGARGSSRELESSRARARESSRDRAAFALAHAVPPWIGRVTAEVFGTSRRETCTSWCVKLAPHGVSHGKVVIKTYIGTDLKTAGHCGHHLHSIPGC